MSGLIERRKVSEPSFSGWGDDGYDDGYDVYVAGAPLNGIVFVAIVLAIGIPAIAVLGSLIWDYWQAVIAVIGVIAALLAVGWLVARAQFGDGFGWRVRVERQKVDETPPESHNSDVTEDFRSKLP